MMRLAIAPLTILAVACGDGSGTPDGGGGAPLYSWPTTPPS